VNPEPRSTDGVVVGNVYDKYATENPVARRLMAGFDRGLVELLEQARPAASVLEVGCGEGHVTAKLAGLFPGARVVGTDFSDEILDTARSAHPGLIFEKQSVYEISRRTDRPDLVVVSEVLEHLEDPERALRALAATGAAHLFLSVPREPIWRALNLARGRYLTALGNTPGHLQHWSRGGFLRLLSRHLEVVDSRSPLPWTQALCRPRRGPAGS
jgi:2-polyprenyl-3-methyl-5-hydroxy-6-metoxy-1,4-benzoquinol methylase